MSFLEAKPLLALFTAMVLAGLKQPVIHPVVCDIGILGSIPLPVSSPAGDNISSSGTEFPTSHNSEVSREQVRR